MKWDGQMPVIVRAEKRRPKDAFLLTPPNPAIFFLAGEYCDAWWTPIFMTGTINSDYGELNFCLFIRLCPK
jgi:hypothetical protein